MNKKCGKCDQNLKIHYEWFCPKCDIHVLQPKIEKVYDLFKIMYHMEAIGYMGKDKFWREFMIENYEFRNDTNISFNLGYYGWNRDKVVGNDLEFFDYLMKIGEVLNLTEEELNQETITVEISW